MPWSGLVSFLLYAHLDADVLFFRSVNALKRACVISTVFYVHRLYSKYCVSMPWSGLVSFLQPHKPGRCAVLCTGVNALKRACVISTQQVRRHGIVVTAVCQCPEAGLCHFYGDGISAVVMTVLCVNALKRACVISTPYIYCDRYRQRDVSMPWSGLVSFLRGDTGPERGPQRSVSMPWSGLVSFLPRLMKLLTFTGVLEGIFWRIYQKISKVSCIPSKSGHEVNCRVFWHNSLLRNIAR